MDPLIIVLICSGSGLVIFFLFLLFIIFKPGQKKKTATDIVKEAKEAGEIGEAMVNDALNDIAKKSKGFLYNNFLFKDKHGRTHEIDHILITRYGFYVIETKNLSGVLYGKESDSSWKKIKPKYNEEKSLENPLIQNENHIKALTSLFDYNAPNMISMVIILNADLSNVNYSSIYSFSDAINELNDKNKIITYTLTEVKLLDYQLNNIQAKYHVNQREHIKNVKANH